jgi:multidrug resistance efflux pump
MADTVPQQSGSDLRATSGLRAVPVLLTLIAVGIAGLAGWATWQAYASSPWTRDGTVLAYVVTIAPQVSGQITHLNVADNQYVHKGDILMTIDPVDYALAVDRVQATADQAALDAANAEREAARRQELGTFSVSQEERQTYVSRAAAADAASRQAKAALSQARLDLQRTDVRSPVNGYVTNLLTHQGDYATTGENLISLVDADSFWITGYFEETTLPQINIGAPATIKLMGANDIIHGHVDNFARGIAVANVQPNKSGLPSVNPIFTWVRLAQRVPVRIHIDQVPEGVKLFVGATATVQVDHPDK